MRRLTLGFVWLLACASSLSQQPRSLIDGAHIQLVGTIALEPRGNNAYIVIKPSQPYTAVFDETDHRKVQEIGLTMDGQWESLKALVGQKVSVSGVIQLEPTSPYYLNGTLILAKSIRLANGSVLTPKPYNRVELLSVLLSSIRLSHLHHGPPRDGPTRRGTTMAVSFPVRRATSVAV